MAYWEEKLRENPDTPKIRKMVERYSTDGLYEIKIPSGAIENLPSWVLEKLKPPKRTKGRVDKL